MPNAGFPRQFVADESDDFPRATPFAVARDEYLLAIEQEGRAPATVAKYRVCIARFARFAGELPPAQIDAVTLRRWAIKLRAEGLSTATQHDYVTWIKVWVKWLAEEGGYGVRAEQTARVKPPTIVQDPIVPFSDDEIRRLYAACERHTFRGLRLRAMLMTMLGTLVRASELLGLRLCDLDLEQKQIVVRPITDKTRKGRTIGIPPEVALDLSRYWNRARMSPGFDLSPESQLFIAESGETLGKKGLESALNRLGKRAKVDNVHPHRFRHTGAINMLLAGVDPFVLMHTLGHTDLTMTKRYLAIVHKDVRHLQRAANWLDKLKLK
jgi:site-specific recombinase XerD